MADKETQVESESLIETLVPLREETPKALNTRRLTLKLFLDCCYQLSTIGDHICKSSPNVIYNLKMVSEYVPACSELISLASRTSDHVVTNSSKLIKILPKIEDFLIMTTPTMKRILKICGRLTTAVETLKQIVSILQQNCRSIIEMFTKVQKRGGINISTQSLEISTMQCEVSFQITETFIDLLDIVIEQFGGVWRMSGCNQNTSLEADISSPAETSVLQKNKSEVYKPYSSLGAHSESNKSSVKFSQSYEEDSNLNHSSSSFLKYKQNQPPSEETSKFGKTNYSKQLSTSVVQTESTKSSVNFRQNDYEDSNSFDSSSTSLKYEQNYPIRKGTSEFGKINDSKQLSTSVVQTDLTKSSVKFRQSDEEDSGPLHTSSTSLKYKHNYPLHKETSEFEKINESKQLSTSVVQTESTKSPVNFIKIDEGFSPFHSSSTSLKYKQNCPIRKETSEFGKMNESKQLSSSVVQTESTKSSVNFRQNDEEDSNSFHSCSTSRSTKQNYPLHKQTFESGKNMLNCSLNETLVNEQNVDLNSSPVSLNIANFSTSTEVSFSHPPVFSQSSDEEQQEEERTQETKISKRKERLSVTSSRAHLGNVRRIFSSVKGDIFKLFSKTRSRKSDL
ncbi:hypothetical protein C0J52_24144 [Blattella germanica]|nr:hypothetical protein C0J52_24144 [Blattella germanica]